MANLIKKSRRLAVNPDSLPMVVREFEVLNANITITGH
jgi:hypothetical protein